MTVPADPIAADWDVLRAADATDAEVAGACRTILARARPGDPRAATARDILTILEEERA